MRRDLNCDLWEDICTGLIKTLLMKFFVLSSAPGQISLDHLHMDVFNSTVARVKWSSPSHPNGPINSYIVEFTLVDEGGTKIGKVWNTTRPGNETNMNVSVKCNGAKVITRVRVAAVNRDAENSVGTWSEPKNVTLCENPGIHVFYIPNGDGCTLHCMRSCFRKCQSIYP